MAPSAFKNKGDVLYLVGKLDESVDGQLDPSDLSPLAEAVRHELVESVCFLGENSLFKTLVECCTPNMLGFDITSDSDDEYEDFEKDYKCGYAAVVSVNEDNEDEFVDKMYDGVVTICLLGHITKGDLRIDDNKYGTISDYIN